MPLTIGGLKIRKTSQVFNENSRLAAFCFAPLGYQKTRFGATLDAMTKRFMNKPTLYIAVEAGEGGGTTSIKSFDVDFVMPETLEEIDKVLTDLYADTHYGGVVLDSSTDMVKRYLLPWSLKMPSRENPESRSKAGVPTRTDYQNMGEKLRQIFIKLINFTTIGGNDPSAREVECRKHVYVTALQRQKFDDETGRLLATGPELPGQMFDAGSMFQLVGTIDMDVSTEPDPTNPKYPKRVETPRFVTKMSQGKYLIKDRYGIMPERAPLNWEEIYEQNWIPALAA